MLLNFLKVWLNSFIYFHYQKFKILRSARSLADKLSKAIKANDHVTLTFLLEEAFVDCRTSVFYIHILL